MQMRIQIFLSNADTDPDPTFHPDATFYPDADPDADPNFKIGSNP